MTRCWVMAIWSFWQRTTDTVCPMWFYILSNAAMQCIGQTMMWCRRMSPAVIVSCCLSMNAVKCHHQHHHHHHRRRRPQSVWKCLVLTLATCLLTLCAVIICLLGIYSQHMTVVSLSVCLSNNVVCIMYTGCITWLWRHVRCVSRQLWVVGVYLGGDVFKACVRGCVCVCVDVCQWVT